MIELQNILTKCIIYKIFSLSLHPKLNIINMKVYIKERAKEKNMTLTDVCEACGYKSLPSFYRQLNNIENVTMQTLIKVANAIGCSVNDLFTPPDSSNDTPTIKCPHCGKPINIHID